MDKKDKTTTKTTTNKNLITSSGPLLEKENSDVQKLILDMHCKMESNPVLNGGFDVLMEKVKNIEDDISELKESVYDQNNGIFTKVKEVENESTIKEIETKNKLNVFEGILNKHEKRIEEESKKTNEYMDKLSESVKNIELKLSEIDLWKKIIIAISGILGGIAINYIVKILGL
jgi:hypothetical protein